MNKKRIAAIMGLAGMGACILCIIVSGFVPAVKDLLWAVGLVCFLVSASISVIFMLRQQEEKAKDAQQKEEQ